MGIEELQDLGMPGNAPGNGDAAPGAGLRVAEVLYAVVEERSTSKLQMQLSLLNLVQVQKDFNRRSMLSASEPFDLR